MITLTYQYKLKFNAPQTQEMEHILSVCKSINNYALAQRKTWYNSCESPLDRCSLIPGYIMLTNPPVAKVSLGLDAGIELLIAINLFASRVF